MQVAAAMRKTTIHSSSRLRMRSSTSSKMFPSAPPSRARIGRAASPSPFSGRAGWGLFRGVTLVEAAPPYPPPKRGGISDLDTPREERGEGVDSVTRSGLRRHKTRGLVDLVDEVLAEAALHF